MPSIPRCSMRRPPSQARLSRQIQAKHSTTVSFDSFLFIDNITNSKIVLKDARKQYQHRQKTTEQEEIQQKELDTLNQCISTLKTTKLFQMDSLRNKIFKSAHHSRGASALSPDGPTLQQKKRSLRQLIQTSITDVSVKELRECIKNPDHRVNPQIIGLQGITGHKLTKTNLLHLVRKIGSAPVQPRKQKQQMKRMKTEQGQIQMQQQHELMQRVDNYFKNTVKDKSAYLIKPRYERQLYQKLYSACSRKKENGNGKDSLKIVANKIEPEEGVFKPVVLGERINQLQKKVRGKKKQNVYTAEEKQILFAVQNNLFFDIESLLIMKKSLVHTRDRKGNNLLHLAAKNRNLQLFTFLLKKSGEQTLMGKNNLGKTPLDIAKLYGVSEIVKHIQNYNPYAWNQ